MRAPADWRHDYRQLMADSGAKASEIMAAAPLPAALEGGVPLSRYLSEPDSLKAIFDGATSLPVQASVWQQELMLSVVAPLTIRLVLQGQAPDPAPEHIHFIPDDASERWRLDEAAESLTLEQFRETVSRRFTDWYPFFRRTLGVSPGAYWSSAGLALCSPFSALYNRADPQQLCRLATAWLESFPCRASKYIDWMPVTFAQTPCAIPQRRGCCLKYLLPDGVCCGTCGLYRKERLAQQAELGYSV